MGERGAQGVVPERNSVSVFLAADNAGGWLLRPGESLTFGRTGGTAECGISEDTTVSATAGVLTATEESVWLHNTSSYATLTLRRSGGGASAAPLEIAPGEALLCPFGWASVVVPVGVDASVALDVEVGALQLPPPLGAALGGDTVELGLDWRARLMRRNASGGLRGRLAWLTVLALCEPLLLGEKRVPTAMAVARRIAWAERDRTPASTEAIAQRLHRVRDRLGLPGSFDPDAGQLLAESLVSRNVVRIEDLAANLDGDDG